MSIQWEAAISAACAKAEEASAKYGDFASLHEAYGVLAEEVAEMLDVVRLQQSDRSRGLRARAEAIDIAAVALRIAESAMRLTR